MAYTRTTSVDSGPAGDSTKQAVIDVDTDLTGIFANLNTHEALTTNAHGFTGAKTGSGAMVGATSPTLVTPTLGVAAATSINKLTITQPANGSTLTIADGKTLTASDTMTLALGAANLKWFMNAAGTAPEWASGIKIGTFTRDTAADSGDVAFTSIGFKPSCVIFFASEPTVAGNYSYGFDDGTTHLYMQGVYSAAGKQAVGSGQSIYMQQDGTKYTTGLIKTFDANGFTITWTKNSTPSGNSTIMYLALR